MKGQDQEDSLDVEMRLHLTDPFPESVHTGVDYGDVEPVLIGADIYGWALMVKEGRLSDVDRARLESAADELERSLGAFPADALPYYERVLRIAKFALSSR
jgi:hypothetical protein